MSVSLRNPTGRNTQAHIVTIGGREYFFSYETCIGYRSEFGPAEAGIRISNSWGPTTGRHFKELSCGDFETVSDEDFARIVEGTTR